MSADIDEPQLSTAKVCLAGTHRVRTPEQTLRWIRPLFQRFGITRLADVTWLDDIGIPVFQAIRPDSLLLSVSQGKGLSPDLARVSAAMESIETWHAERLPPGETADVADVAGKLPYELDELAVLRPNCVNEHTRLEWSVARRLDDGSETFLPMALLRLDGRVSSRWTPPHFNHTTNGLASGNTFEEAALHGLFEVIERDALVQSEVTQERYKLALETVDGAARLLVEAFARANVDVYVEQLPSRFGLPCFRARIWSDTFPVLFAGFGCHRDRDVSLCRALTEAAQSRVTAIAGTRDDILKEQYRRGRRARAGLTERPDLERGSTGPTATRAFDDIESTTSLDMAEDLADMTRRVSDVLGRAPLVATHTRRDVGVPVVHVVCPRMRFEMALL